MEELKLQRSPSSILGVQVHTLQFDTSIERDDDPLIDSEDWLPSNVRPINVPEDVMVPGEIINSIL